MGSRVGAPVRLTVLATTGSVAGEVAVVVAYSALTALTATVISAPSWSVAGVKVSPVSPSIAVSSANHW